MNFARLFASQLCLLVLFALFLHVANAETYGINVILPRTGGLDNTLYEAAAQAADLAKIDINSLWTSANTGDTLVVTVKDSASDGATSMRLGYEAAQDASVLAVVGAGPDNMTLPMAQLLYNWDVRFSVFLALLSLPNPRPYLLLLLMCVW